MRKQFLAQNLKHHLPVASDHALLVEVDEVDFDQRILSFSVVCQLVTLEGIPERLQLVCFTLSEKLLDHVTDDVCVVAVGVGSLLR